MRPYSLDDAIKTFGKLVLQFISTFFIRFKKAVQFPEENENTTDHGKHWGGGGGGGNYHIWAIDMCPEIGRVFEVLNP